jgi:hypothetical protein
MNQLLYILGEVLIIIWAILFFAYDKSGLVHIILVNGIAAIVIQAARNAPTMPDDFEN